MSDKKERSNVARVQLPLYVQWMLLEARKTYGRRDQISVAAEECSELAAVLQKYIRYDVGDEAIKQLHDKVLTEVADVMNGLDHIIHIFGFTEAELAAATTAKAERLERWMKSGESLQRSMTDREVRPLDELTSQEKDMDMNEGV